MSGIWVSSLPLWLAPFLYLLSVSFFYNHHHTFAFPIKLWPYFFLSKQMIPCASNAASLNVRESKTVLDSGLGIPNSSRLQYSRSFKLNSRFQSPGFRIAQAKNRAVIKGGGPGGISSGFHEHNHRPLPLENRRKIEAKEIPNCLIPRLLVVFTWKLGIQDSEIRITSLGASSRTSSVDRALDFRARGHRFHSWDLTNTQGLTIT